MVTTTANSNTVKSKRMPLIALCLGFFMVIIDVTIVNVALPSIAKNLSGNVSWLQWVVDGYTLTFACLLLSAGNLGDRMGAKMAFQCGLILFVLTSLCCGLANSFWSLTVFRLIQGIAGALLVPTSLALINASYDNNQERAHVIGIWASVGGIAAAAGPILGGILTSWFNWRAVFFVNLPIGIIGALLTAKYVTNPSGRQTGSFDFPGQLLGIISIGALAFSLIEAGRIGWLAPLVIAGFIIFLLTFVLFLLIEQRTASPMFPLNLFNSKTFSVAIAVGMMMTLALYGELFVLTLYFQQIRAYSPLITGFAFFPLVGIVTISSYFGGKMTSVVGPKWPMIIGLAIGSIGFLSMLIVTTNIPYVMLILPMTIMGFGISFTVPAATVAAVHSAPGNRAGIASGAFNASRQIGSLLGVALLGTMINSSSSFMIGMHLSLILSSFLLLISCLITFIYITDDCTHSKK